MRGLKLLFAIVICLSVFRSTAQDVQYFYNSAKTALQEKKYQQFDSLIKRAYELHPYNQNILWHVGLAAALTNRPEEAISFLTRAININSSYDLNDVNLDPLRKTTEFQRLIKAQTILNTAVVKSDTAYVIDDRQLHLESVAFDPVGQSLFCGSIHKRKIIKVDKTGTATDFTSPEQHGMGAVFGLKIDAKKRILWACASAIPEMQHYDSTLTSSLFRFDIESGKLLNAYAPTDTVGNHIFGDVVLDSKGVPYVSDSRNNIIYKYDSERQKLLPYFSSKAFWNIQGMAFSENDKILYIADYIKGIFALEIQAMKLSKINVSYDLSLKGSDGILFFKNSLITIQNGVQPNRVVRHYLDPSGYEFLHYEYIDNAHPAFGEPTIGTISGNTMYYVANSQWNGYEDGAIKKPAELKPIVVLKHEIKVFK